MTPEPVFLYIEDHPASRRVFQLIMTTILDYEDVTLLSDANNIIEQLNLIGKCFDVIFLDLNMSPVDGYETCRLLRQEAAYQSARVIGLTANVTPAIIRKMQDHGFDGVIGKPISHETFAEKISIILENKPLWEDYS